LDITRLSRQVLFNCDVSDARYAGIYSVCGLAMRLRDLYKWERRLPPWQEDDAARVLEWIGRKEDQWETLLETDYDRLSVSDQNFEPFDTQGINAALNPCIFFYGAGYAHSMKPTFFLAKIDREETVAGHRVRYLGREYARDLLTLPAFSQDGEVVLRAEAARMFLWDQIAYISNTGRRALDFALTACGLPDTRTQTIRKNFDTVLKAQQQIYLRHEIGELEETVFDREVWQHMLADYPHTAVELLVRTLKDLLADTSPHGALVYLLQNRDEAALGLYLAFGNGITRLLTGELVSAFDAFGKDHEWQRMTAAAQAVRQKAAVHTARVMELYQEGRIIQDMERTRAAIEDYMRRCIPQLNRTP
jgi:hypothetical protein